MASIVAEQQDLFFEFDFDQAALAPETDKTLQQCKKDIFLIGCFRTDQKQQLEWIRVKVDEQTCGKYNVRLGKGRNGWINKENPRIANPDYVILYEFGNEKVVYCYKAGGSSVYTEEEMRQSGYVDPKGDYLVYKLLYECSFPEVDVSKILALYRERTTWIDGKPIYLTGREIIAAQRPQVKEKKRQRDSSGSVFDDSPIMLDEVIKGISYDFHYPDHALTSIDLFSGCGGLT